jgi:hypothetical protein
MLERIDAITNEVLEPNTLVLAYPTVFCSWRVCYRKWVSGLFPKTASFVLTHPSMQHDTVLHFVSIYRSVPKTCCWAVSCADAFLFRVHLGKCSICKGRRLRAVDMNARLIEMISLFIQGTFHMITSLSILRTLHDPVSSIIFSVRIFCCDQHVLIWCHIRHKLYSDLKDLKAISFCSETRSI